MTWGRHSAALVSIALIAAGLSACSGAEAETSKSATTPTASATPLPGVTDTAMTVGVIADDLNAGIVARSLQLGAPEFSGLSAEQVAAFLPTSTVLGGRTVTVNATPFAPKDRINAPDEPVQALCAAQKSSAVVITDVPNRGLTDCLIKNGSIVIDASVQAWDTTALNERAPLLWASATAAADTAEKVLLSQAQQRGVLPEGKATVIKGADEVSHRVAEQVTIPTLTWAGLNVTGLGELTESDLGTGRGPAVEELLASDPALVRPMDSLGYGTLGAFAIPADGSTLPTLLITSNDGPTSAVRNEAVVAATQGLGWSPLRDGASPAGSASSPAAAQACAATYPGITFTESAYLAASFLYRWCDAMNLLRIGAVPTGPLTDTAFRDAVWSSSTTWNPAAVFASSWTTNSYAGANQSRWFTGNDTCPSSTQGCFTYAEGTIPLT